MSLKRELQAAADATIERFGAVNILVNNAGIVGGGPYGVWDDALWDWTLGVNLMSVISGVEIFGPLIEKAGAPGQIVSTASIAGLLSRTSMPYNVSKCGVVALSEGLRVDLAPHGIGVSVLCPRLHPHADQHLAPQPARALTEGRLFPSRFRCRFSKRRFFVCCSLSCQPSGDAGPPSPSREPHTSPYERPLTLSGRGASSGGRTVRVPTSQDICPTSLAPGDPETPLRAGIATATGLQRHAA